jgi:hypothetical protein
MNQNGRPWYFWPLISFVVGLLIGWLVIGWGLWPVTWTNALVQDLRPDLRNQYVTMVAESYAQTRNLDQARGRLAGWSPEDLSKVLSDVQEVQVARDIVAAQNVQDLAVAIGSTRGTTGETPGQDQTPVRPTATSSPPASGTTSSLRRFCTAGIFVCLALAALALMVYLFKRWRAVQSGAGANENEPLFDALESTTTAAAAAEQEKARWTTSEPSLTKDDQQFQRGGSEIPTPAGRDEVYATESRSSVRDDRASSPLRPVGPAPVAAGQLEPTVSRIPAQPTPVQPISPSTEQLQKLTENKAVYQMGESDYDEAFDINDPVDGYMGQCGLQLIEPFGRERDQAVALQVWLWDSSDPDTQAMVLMSEGVYRDTSLRSEHEGEHKSQPVKPGTEFELHSHDLLLHGRVEKVSYAEAEPPRGVFAELHVKLTVYRRA